MIIILVGAAQRKYKGQAGIPQAVAIKITRHKTDSMFRRYAIVTVEQQRDALPAAEVYRQQQKERSKVAHIN